MLFLRVIESRDRHTRYAITYANGRIYLIINQSRATQWCQPVHFREVWRFFQIGAL